MPSYVRQGKTIDRSARLERASETRDERIHRLAKEARNAGLQVAEYPDGNMVFCTSRRQPDRLHRVTHVSCDCQGFIHTGCCAHYALFLHHINAMPPLPPSAGTVRQFKPRRPLNEETAA